MSLCSLRFADIAVDLDAAGSRYKRVGDSLELCPVPGELWHEIDALRASMLSHQVSRFRMAWGAPPMILRVQRRDTPAGPVFVARRIDSELRAFEALGLSAPLMRKLRQPGLRGGMVLFAGSPGSGKTTAASSMMIDRLEQIGGFAWTAENPVEYHLQGSHGKGQCYQEEIEDDRDVKRVLMDTLRSSADILYIGEIREDEAAHAACLAANSGLLVIATIHADNIIQAISKIGLLAGNGQIASSLRAVVALRLEHKLSAAAGPERVLKAESLFLDDEPTRMKVRDGNVAALNMDIERQRNLMLVGAGV